MCSSDLSLQGRVLNNTFGKWSSHQRWTAGAVDAGYHCSRGVTHKKDGTPLNYQTGTTLYEVLMEEDSALIDDITGLIKMPKSKIMMPAADRGFVDSLEGTFTWDYSPLPCIDSFTQIFRGEVKVYGNETSLVGALALAETEDVGVEIGRAHV